MLRYLSRRLLEALLALLFTSILVFSMIHMIPGDPALLVAGLEAGPEVVERIRRDLGLDRPLPVQYGSFLLNALQGDFGISIRTGLPVLREIVDRFPYTLVIALGAIVLATAMGIGSGILAAMRHNRLGDALVMVAALLAVST
ncbi:MAG: ABC transporter permease, partial [Vicinamibacteria bacterium]